MCDLWHHLGVGSIIRRKLVRDDCPWCIAQAFEQHSEKTFGGFCISSFLNEDVEHRGFLIHGSPQVHLLAIDLQENFIQMPRVAAAETQVTQSARVLSQSLRLRGDWVSFRELLKQRSDDHGFQGQPV